MCLLVKNEDAKINKEIGQIKNTVNVTKVKLEEE